MDSDGDLDVLIGNNSEDSSSGNGYSNGIAFQENTGSPTNPSFAAPIGNNDTNPFGLDVQDNSSRYHLTGMDFDGDGDLDLFIERQGSGYIDVYENTGSATAPAFSGSFTRRNSVSGDAARPTAADFDGDGRDEILVGLTGGTGGNRFELYEVSNNGSFFGPVANTFSNMALPSGIAPAAADLDQDGDLDILAGDASGNLIYFENTGTANIPSFSGNGVANPFGPNSIPVSAQAIPTFADLDGDGALDLIVGGGYTNGGGGL